MNTPLRAKDPRSSASPELRAVLEHASTSVPDAARLAALTDAVLAKLPAAPVAAAKVGLLPTLGGKLLLVGLASALSVTGYVLLRPAESARPRVSEPEKARALEPSAPAAPVVAPAPSVVAPLAPELPAARPEQRRARKVNTPAPSVDDFALLQAARAVRRSAPADALRKLDEHARLFPASAFGEEREAMAIGLLRHLDPARADERLRSFDAKYPGSAYRPGLAK